MQTWVDLTGHDGLYGAGTALHNIEKSIYNVRIGAFCNRIRYDFVGTKSRSTMKEKNG